MIFRWLFFHGLPLLPYFELDSLLKSDLDPAIAIVELDSLNFLSLLLALLSNFEVI